MLPQRVAVAAFTKNLRCQKIVPKITKQLGYFLREFVAENFKKIAQSCHTLRDMTFHCKGDTVFVVVCCDYYYLQKQSSPFLGYKRLEIF